MECYLKYNFQQQAQKPSRKRFLRNIYFKRIAYKKKCKSIEIKIGYSKLNY